MIRLDLGEDINAVLDERGREARERERRAEVRRQADEAGDPGGTMGANGNGQGRSAVEKFAIGFLGTIVAGASGWYVTTQVLEVRVTDHERRIVALEPLPDRVSRTEERLAALVTTMQRIERKLDTLEEKIDDALDAQRPRRPPRQRED